MLHSTRLGNEAADLEQNTVPSSRSDGYRFAALGQTELLGLCDQAIASGVNFLTIVVVARAVSPSEFGYFVLAFTAILTALTFQSAVITRPHNVLAAGRRGAPYANYSTTAAAVQVAFTCSLGALCVVAAGLAQLMGSSRALLLLALALALIAWQLQEFGRRILYTEGRLVAAIANDALSYGGYAAALVVLWRLDLLTVTRALLALAVAFAIGAAVMSRQLNEALSGKLDASSLAESWGFGKWLGLAEASQWFSTQFVYYLAAAVIGSVASGALKAGQTLLGPVAAFLAFFTSYLPILFAGELERSGTLGRKVRWSFSAILPLVIAYSLVAAFFAEPLLEYVYGPKYGQYASVVELFAIYYVALSFSTVAVAMLSARGMTRQIFAGTAAGAALSLAAGWLLLREFGPAGGVAGMLASWAVSMAFYVRATGLRTAGTPIQ